MNTKPVSGMRDFLPIDLRRREYVIRLVREGYERYGFEPLETPAVENIETLMGQYGEESKLIFKILKRGEHEKTGQADLALRYDLTVPLARVVAEYRNDLPKFFKRYQIQPVWRADRPGHGRFREFYQCDVDIIGSRSMVVEAEVCSAVSDVLLRLGFEDFIVRINHRQVLAGILSAAGIEADKHGAALIALDKLDKIGRDGVAKELSDRGIAEAASGKLLNFFAAISSISPAEIREEVPAYNRAVLERLTKFMGASEAGANGVGDLRSIVELTAASGLGPRLRIDPALARGLSYYTGTIMEVNVPDMAGSLGGGGRYDNLVERFSDQGVPACGFSLGLERIIVVMTERNMFPAEAVSAPADVMVTIWNEAGLADSLSLARDLRTAGLRVDVYPEADKLGKQFKYASARGIPYVAIIGDSEKAAGQVALKNMETGEQEAVSIEQLIERTKSAIK